MMQRFALCFVCLVALAAPATASPVRFFEYYYAVLSGPAEEPANSSPGADTHGTAPQCNAIVDIVSHLALRKDTHELDLEQYH